MANPETIDEAPMAYKRMEDIIDAIRESVDIVEMIKPVYNFKSAMKPDAGTVLFSGFLTEEPSPRQIPLSGTAGKWYTWIERREAEQHER